jgi:hypothetical protein
MAKVKSGTAIPPQDPKAPKDPLESITTDPGSQSEITARNRDVKKTNLDSVKVKPEPPQSESGEEEPIKLTWISVELQDNDGKAVPFAPFVIEYSDKTFGGGATGSDGKCKLEGVAPGSVKINFIGIDKREWKPK